MIEDVAHKFFKNRSRTDASPPGGGGSTEARQNRSRRVPQAPARHGGRDISVIVLRDYHSVSSTLRGSRGSGGPENSIRMRITTMNSHTTDAYTTRLADALINLTSRAAAMLDRYKVIDLDLSDFELTEEDIEDFNVEW